jgi:hypothetical protein
MFIFSKMLFILLNIPVVSFYQLKIVHKCHSFVIVLLFKRIIMYLLTHLQYQTFENPFIIHISCRVCRMPHLLHVKCHKEKYAHCTSYKRLSCSSLPVFHTFSVAVNRRCPVVQFIPSI